MALLPGCPSCSRAFSLKVENILALGSREHKAVFKLAGGAVRSVAPIDARLAERLYVGGATIAARGGVLGLLVYRVALLGQI
jgi:hypothetical protein